MHVIKVRQLHICISYMYMFKSMHFAFELAEFYISYYWLSFRYLPSLLMNSTYGLMLISET